MQAEDRERRTRKKVHALPDGVTRRPLVAHEDPRGALIEIFRDAWPDAIRALQWNVLVSRAGVLRGVHVHPRHDDFVVLLSGRCFIGLKDMRADSQTAGMTACVEMDGDARAGWKIPHGVAHGMWFPTDATFLQGASEAYDPLDEVRCRYDDAELGIDWPLAGVPLLSACDADGPTYAEALAVYRARSPR